MKHRHRNAGRVGFVVVLINVILLFIYFVGK